MRHWSNHSNVECNENLNILYFHAPFRIIHVFGGIFFVSLYNVCLIFIYILWNSEIVLLFSLTCAHHYTHQNSLHTCAITKYLCAIVCFGFGYVNVKRTKVSHTKYNIYFLGKFQKQNGKAMYWKWSFKCKIIRFISVLSYLFSFYLFLIFIVYLDKKHCNFL